MRKPTIIFLVLIVLLTVVGCNQGVASKPDSDTPKKNVIKADKHNSFFGVWRVKRWLPLGDPSIYSKDDLDKLVGRKVEYNIRFAKYGNDSIRNPIYSKTIYTEDEFFDWYRVSFANLGIKGKTVTAYNINTSQNEPWGSIPDEFIYKNDKQLIVFDQGAFLELERTK